MNPILKYTYHQTLTSLLESRCNSPIPRSGKAGEQVNCFTIELRKEDSPFLLVDAITESGLDGLKWSETDHQYKEKAHVSFCKLKEYKLIIIHYYGLATIKFDGLFDYLIKGKSQWIYFKIWWNGVQQELYNRRKNFSLKRIDILQIIVEMHLEKNGNAVSSWEVMNKLHSTRWLNHPQSDTEHDRLRFFLDSLVETQDIEQDNTVPFYYKAKGKALKTLSDFSLDEERHEQSILLQKKMAFLTWIVAFSAFLTVCITTMTITKDSLLWEKIQLHFLNEQKDVSL